MEQAFGKSFRARTAVVRTVEFQKETAQIPDCCRVPYSFGGLNAEAYLQKLPERARNAQKTAAVRKKWDVIVGEKRNEELLAEWSELETVLSDFPCRLIKKAHISMMPAGSQLPIHQDGFDPAGGYQTRFEFFNETLRFHIPLKTNDESLIFSNGLFYHMDLDECWMLNNFRNHSAINLSDNQPRFHLILDVIPNSETLQLLNKGQPDLGFSDAKVRARLKRAEYKKGASSVHKGPSFFIPGAMKSGTTSLFQYLSQHPKIKPPDKKELNHFGRAPGQMDSREEYAKRFPRLRPDEMTFEATPYYLMHPNVPAQIKKDFPDARFVILLRNPVDRAYSHYQQRVSKGHESREFGEAIRLEPELDVQRFRNDSDYRETKFGEYYLERGRYLRQLKRWYRHFPEDRFKIIFTKDIKGRPKETIQDVFAFLGLDPFEPVDVSRKFNKSTYPPMSENDRRWLNRYFAPKNKKLSRFLARELPW